MAPPYHKLELRVNTLPKKSYRHFLEVFTGFLYLMDSGARLPRLWLHILCARRMLLRSMCDPPFDTGMISSASGDIGCSTQPSQ